MKIAFIGLGIMGKPMAKNLIKAGHELFVFDRNPAANEEMKAAGANICASSADTVKNVDLVITMLPNSPQVKSVMLEEDKLADAMPKTAVFIDCSSINPVASREIAAELEKRGIDMLDAPVSGGQPRRLTARCPSWSAARKKCSTASSPFWRAWARPWCCAAASARAT